ncbi:elongation of very long chain fatty acids protein [Leguminivora glycinivorella]|uniref:elongation of very long chain fatty acids protein n=1 Tax=Leguminivora glycinivorella TaxID=1035111 RepID=UPI00200D4CC6|nr:elongation of very long chain fatty acids protein [Leguminivora glycinivorella]
MDHIVRAYDIVFYERADPRVLDWPLMGSPWPLFFILTGYLAAIKILVPAYMKNRPPYELRSVIRWYNVVQIISNAVVTWGIMTSGWTTTYHFGCMLPDYSLNPEPLRMLRFLWWTIIVKIIELLETMFFLLRKKDKQASFLHVYHHCGTLVVVWAGTKYVGGGIASFSTMLNTAVHVVMYLYYLLSADGSPGVKATLNKYKKWLTILQMIQFTLMIVYSSQVFLPSCPASTGVALLFFANVIIVFYMFLNFFRESYVRKGKVELNGNKKKSE